MTPEPANLDSPANVDSPLENPADEGMDQWVTQMRQGDSGALGEVFAAYQERLRGIIRFRLDYRLAGRFSESDVLQETYIAAATRLKHFGDQPDMPAFLWLRLLATQQMIDLQRKHLKAEKRDVRREISIQQPQSDAQTSLCIAARLVGDQTGVSQLIQKAEQIAKLEEVLNTMDAIDREVIALRHFEELSNIETARVLQIDPSAASKRYVRAMARLAELIVPNDK
ncbi:MAG: sigma-70 family RNA polymerase sigma factor [Planctomycetota bacterium]